MSRNYLVLITSFLVYFSIVSCASPGKEVTRISGTIANASEDDSVTLHVWETLFTERSRWNLPHAEIKAPLVDGRFEIETDEIQSTSYFSLVHGGRELISMYLASPGDDVEILFRNGHITFAGEGAGKHKCLHKIVTQYDSLRDNFFRSLNLSMDDPEQYLQSLYSVSDSIYAINQKILKNYQDRMTKEEYELVKAEILGKKAFVQWDTYLYGSKPIERFYPDVDIEKLNSINEKLYSRYTSDKKDILDIPKVWHSKNSLKYLLLASTEGLDNNSNPIEVISTAYEGKLRDHLLVSYLVDSYTKTNAAYNALQNTLSIVQDEDCRAALQNLLLKEGAGSQAFDFNLPDKNSSYKKLSDFRGRVVLLEFWITGCSGCLNYYKNVLGPVEDQLSENDEVAFISVGVDKDKERWLESIESGMYTSERAINLFTEGKGEKHEVIQQYNVTYFPKPILIDRNGRVITSSKETLKDKDKLLTAIEKALEK